MCTQAFTKIKHFVTGKAPQQKPFFFFFLNL